MNSRFIIMLVLALILAGAAAWIANNWIKSQSVVETTSAGITTVPVVVASTKIPFGARIEASQIKLLGWPKDNAPENAFSDPKLIVGKITTRSFIPNEIILKSQIREYLGGSTLSALITEGKRAMTVRVNDIVGVAGFILPGNKVDILYTHGKPRVTQTLFRNMKILAIGQMASTDKNQPTLVRSFTLEVTPKQSEILVKAMKSGSLSFTLRNPLDDDTLTKPGEKKTTKKIKITPPEPPSVIIIPWTSNHPKKCDKKVC